MVGSFRLLLRRTSVAAIALAMCSCTLWSSVCAGGAPNTGVGGWLDRVEAPQKPDWFFQHPSEWEVQAQWCKAGAIGALLGDVHTWSGGEWATGRQGIAPDQIVLWFQFAPKVNGRLNSCVVRFIGGPLRGVIARVCPKGWASKRNIVVHALLVAPEDERGHEGKTIEFDVVGFLAK